MQTVTIFIQAFNLDNYIGECVQSVLNLRGPYDLEVLVVDDASTDKTLEIIKDFSDSRINLIVNEKNLGCIETANIGYREARGEFCARLDGDDRYRPDFLEKTIPIFESNPNVGVVYGDIAMIDPSGNISSPSGCVARQRENRPGISNELIPLMKSNFLPAPTTIGRTKIWQSILPIPSSLYFLDYYMTTQAAHVCDFGFVDKVLADYRIHPGNQHSRMILDKSGEKSTFEMLKRAYNRAEFKSEKEKYRTVIDASHFLNYAENYFGAGMTNDARRCYWQAFIRSPSFLINLGILRRYLGTIIGKPQYEYLKKYFVGSNTKRAC